MPAPVESCQAICEHINRYLTYLSEQHGLSVSLHMPGCSFFVDYWGLLPFHVHRTRFCEKIKEACASRFYCHYCQRMVVAALCGDPTPRYGRCVFGMEEYILPIRVDGGKVHGFISVTGYTTDPEKTLRAAEHRFARLGLPAPDLTDCVAELSRELPPPELLDTLLHPIADLAGMLPMRDQLKRRPVNYVCSFLTEYIELHYDEKLSTATLARAAHCSVSYINHAFKNFTGVSVSRFIAETRIRHAKKLLADDRFTIKAVALGVGYDDTNYFSVVFREITGMTPTEWRRR